MLSLLQKHSAALTAKTEKTLAQRAGHLELLKGGGRRTGRKRIKEDKKVSVTKAKE